MSNLSAYYRLMRFHKPTGMVLLWVPTAWALWLANQGMPAWSLLIYFLLGTVCMRAAGCVINDIADRHIDIHVERTHLRPLTAGELGLVEALILLIVLLFIALIIVAQLPVLCFYEALFALLATLIYPFCKRFFQAPQLVLGITFSMGIPMAYAASGVSPNVVMGLLFFLNCAWIVAYDTMYAMVDRDDDLQIGVKSTAVLFASYDRVIIAMLQVLLHGTWLMLGLMLHASVWFYVFWLVALCLIGYQQQLIGLRTHADYFRAFLTNGWYGVIMWVGLILGL
ncbi:MAG: 4-hydroxybenzoate octaprenyltransferase [Legionellaceae bacterium]|nr:4-hydroxybenzoate octaprenyltransferase [Legionellaceae bacterium]